MWPKSSESSSVSDSAPQLSATNGRSLRGELKWIARATSSLPVPHSPVMSTVLLVGAIVSTSWNTASIGVAAADDVRELVRRLERALEQHVLLLQPLALELLADAQRSSLCELSGALLT